MKKVFKICKSTGDSIIDGTDIISAMSQAGIALWDIDCWEEVNIEVKKTLIRRYESRGMKYWVELWYDGNYHYKTDNGCGFLGSVSFDTAIREIEKQISYCPSKLKLVLDTWATTD